MTEPYDRQFMEAVEWDDLMRQPYRDRVAKDTVNYNTYDKADASGVIFEAAREKQRIEVSVHDVDGNMFYLYSNEGSTPGIRADFLEKEIGKRDIEEYFLEKANRLGADFSEIDFYQFTVHGEE